MGYVPVPCVPPPLSREEIFRRSITPPADRTTAAVGWVITILLLALVVVPIVWLLSVIS